MKYKFLFLLFISHFAEAQITTPYPETIQLKQINSAGKERARLAQWFTQLDRQPTGFFIEAGKEIVINVEILTPAADGAVPRITIGTPGFHFDNRLPASGAFPSQESNIRPGRHALTAGINRITPNYSGLIYFSFVSGAEAEPTGEARITFTNESQHTRAPRYVFGVTSDSEFALMMQEYQTQDVIFQSDYAVVTASRETVLSVSLSENKNQWFEALHHLIEAEHNFSGMDANDPNPVHHPLKGGEMRYLLTENLSTAVAHASNEYTGYNSNNAIGRGFLRVDLGEVAHEIGHQSQQPAYLIGGAVEGSVHQYVAAVQRARGLTPTRVGEWTWGLMQSFWNDRTIPVSRLRYEMTETEIHELIRYEAVMNYTSFIRMVWEQLYLIFGDEFYPRLHRITREEGVQGGNNIHNPTAIENDERRAYLIWKASQITGYDLTEYFNHWGIRVTNSQVKQLLRARIYTALANGDIEPLPYPLNDVLSVSGQQIPDWAPLQLKGITSSMPKEEILEIEKNSLLTPSEPYKFKVIVEAEGIVASHSGELQVDEDSELVIEFTLLTPEHRLREVIIDGMAFQPTISGNVYTIRRLITNHSYIYVTASVTLSDDASIAEILVDNKPAIKSPFNASIYELTIDFATHITISATPANPLATINANDIGVKSVREGINRLDIRVIAENGNISSYRLEVFVNEDPNKITTSIDDNLKNNIKIFPNPVVSGQMLTIDLSGANLQTGILRIIGADGKILDQINISNTIEMIEMNYVPGVYFMHVKIDDEDLIFRVVAE